MPTKSFKVTWRLAVASRHQRHSMQKSFDWKILILHNGITRLYLLFFPVGVLLRRWPENQSHDSFKGGYSVIYLTWSLRICLESRSWLPIPPSYSRSTVLALIFSIGFLCFFNDKYPTPTLPPHSCIDFILWLEEGLLDQFNWREKGSFREILPYFDP